MSIWAIQFGLFFTGVQHFNSDSPEFQQRWLTLKMWMQLFL
jgi:hypothetical protein